MNVLVLSTWFPFPPDNGARLRAYHLIRHLAARHRLHLVVGRQDDAPEAIPAELRALAARLAVVPWRWYQPGASGTLGALRALVSETPRSLLETPNPALAEAIARELAQPIDLVLALSPGMDHALPALPGTLPAVLDEVEVSGMIRKVERARSAPERLRHALTLGKGLRYWRRRFSRYAALTAVSQEEAAAVRRFVGARGPAVSVVPNGVDVAAYPPPAAAPAPGRLIYNGALSYALNREAVRWFLEAIFPQIVARVPEAHLVVTGRAQPEHLEGIAGHPQVTLTGFVKDLRPTLAEASVMVCPLLAGGGTRLKILEAWAAGLPVVSTRIGAAGLEGAQPGTHLLLDDEPGAFADSVVSLLRDPARRSALAQAGRALAAARYDWGAVGAQLDSLLEQVAAKAKSA